MGNMVNVTLLTDCWDQMKKDPKLFEEIEKRAFHYGDYPDAYGGGLHVEPYRHSSDFVLYAMQGNTTIELSKYNPRTMELVERNDSMRDLLRSQIKTARFLLEGLEEEIEAHDS